MGKISKNLKAVFSSNSNKVAGLILLSAAAIYGYGYYENHAANTLSQEERETLQQVDISSVENMTLGSETAPIEIIEFASFTCSHCANFSQNVFPHLKKNYIDTGHVKFTHQEVYTHQYALWASVIARCDGTKSYFPIIEDVYAHFDSWTSAVNADAVLGSFKIIAEENGISSENFDQCMNDTDNAKVLTTWSMLERDKYDIKSTPSIIIDGENFGNLTYEEMSEIVDEKLKQKTQ